MKNKRFILAVLAVLPLCFAMVACGNGGDPNGDDDVNKPSDVLDENIWVVQSPDGKLSAELMLDNFGTPYYRVKKDDLTVVDYSSLGFTLEEDDLSQMLMLDGVATASYNFTYDNISGKHSTVEASCNETTLTLSGSSFYLDITLRAYDDGYAFKYDIRGMDGGSGTVTVIEENSQFAIPDNSNTWTMQYKTNTANKNCFSYEESYTRRKSRSLSGKDLSMPMLYKVGDTDVYSLITESGLIGSGYYGSFLRESIENEGTGILQTVQSPAGVQTDGNKISYPFTSPWRVGITGSLAEVQESELVEKVYDDVDYWRPDDYDSLSAEEKKTYDYDWVEPGVVAWDWLKYQQSQTDYDLHRSYVELAAEMGWKYVILDGGWNNNLNVDSFKTFTDYAHSKGVKIIAWCNALTDFGTGSQSLLANKLDVWKSYGIDGIKIDFFDGQNATNPPHQGEDINTIAWYETIYQECAKRQMVVNCHGSNKPTGERRLYPNVINREAVRGNEFANVDSTIIINSLFVRSGIGPSDFTPVVKPLSKGLTMGQQMALAILYESGAPSMADLVDTYADATIKDFYKAIPSLRDDTVFLCGELDGYYVAAVRAGDEWFVAGASSYGEAFTADFDYSFLGDGEYTATYFTDAEGDHTSVVRSVNTVDKTHAESVQMEANGGFVIRLVKK